jgi:transcriptional regulator with XRE-family HTH domain
VEKRKEKGYSLDNMAEELEISTPAYTKIEKQETKLTFERLLQIQNLLDIPLQDLLDIQVESVYHQNLQAQSVGYQAGVQNLYQENKETTQKLVQILEQEIEHLKSEIEFLRDIAKR